MDRRGLRSEKALRHRRKSRFGCRNCKLRKLKCDEARPHCMKCRNYGVLCNFEYNVLDFQPLSEEKARQDVGDQLGLPSPQLAISNAIWADDGSTFFMIDREDQELFNRFRYRTLYSLGGTAMVEIYKDYMLAASFTCPFLMHGSLAVSAVHDRYLGVAPSRRRSLRESYHWSQCTSLFGKFLSQPLQEKHKDPLWATAGITAILTFASINSSALENTWPLGAPDPSDLEWVRLGAAKMSLWHLIDPLRPGSVFRHMSETLANMRQSLPTNGAEGVWAEFQEICGLDELSTQGNNPYFAVAHSLSRLLDIAEDEPPQGRVMMVSGHMHRQFGTCLEKKDPIALLLLCIWYTKAREAYWWIDLRARQELPAICAYLQRYHKDNSSLQKLIPWNEIMAVQ